ncbi:MAG: ribonuclease D [Alphaproteobacteria bacterium]|nr:MAG: ribonuclease D [Alphaproteobacteria bacterium]
MSVITSNDQLVALCQRLEKSEYITVDTEFLRTKTYYSKLCLIQVANEEEFHAIDPLAPGINLDPFYDLMTNENILKIFHASRQDIEIFVNEKGVVPKPLFDSQVAAMVCGYGDSIGYEKLVLSMAGATLDKSTRITDWSRRPLTQRQIDYALGDVTHLRVIYKKLNDQLIKTDRSIWLSEEMADLTNPETFIVRPENAWKRLKIRSSNRLFNAVARALAEWRENEAQTRNLPRNRVMRDEVLLEVSAVRPEHANALGSIRGLSPQFSQSKSGQNVLAAVKRVLEQPVDSLPVISRKRPPAQNTDPVMELLKVLLKLICQNEHVAPKLIASVDDLEKLAESDQADIPALHGWRYDLFGKQALAVKRGEVAFSMKNGEIILIPTPATETDTPAEVQESSQPES